MNIMRATVSGRNSFLYLGGIFNLGDSISISTGIGASADGNGDCVWIEVCGGLSIRNIFIARERR